MRKDLYRLLMGGLFLLSLPLAADTDSVLDRIYGESEAPLLPSAWLIYVGAGVLDEEAPLSDALALLEEKGWNGETPLTRGKLALLLMENFSLPQGIMYRLTHWEHYALREVLYLNILGGRGDKSAPASGFDVINGLSALLEEA